MKTVQDSTGRTVKITHALDAPQDALHVPQIPATANPAFLKTQSTTTFNLMSKNVWKPAPINTSRLQAIFV